jgi:hypothetical protein
VGNPHLPLERMSAHDVARGENGNCPPLVSSTSLLRLNATPALNLNLCPAITKHSESVSRTLTSFLLQIYQSTMGGDINTIAECDSLRALAKKGNAKAREFLLNPGTRIQGLKVLIESGDEVAEEKLEHIRKKQRGYDRRTYATRKRQRRRRMKADYSLGDLDDFVVMDDDGNDEESLKLSSKDDESEIVVSSANSRRSLTASTLGQ